MSTPTHSYTQAHTFSVAQVSTYDSTVPVWVLALGGVGVVIGLATYGYKVRLLIKRRVLVNSLTHHIGACAGIR